MTLEKFFILMTIVYCGALLLLVFLAIYGAVLFAKRIKKKIKRRKEHGRDKRRRF